MTTSIPNTGISYTQSLSNSQNSADVINRPNEQRTNNQSSKSGIIFFVFLMLIAVYALAGCANLVHKQNSNFKSEADSTNNCTYVQEHYQQDGTYISEAYQCNSDIGQNFISANSCSYVSGYYKNDGAYISGHYRCSTIKNSSSPSYSSSYGSGQSASSCVTSYCGSVNVRGYTRKDGTYVRPHTRSRAKK
ncbi:MAG: hypothetical protein H6996_00060 [Moraxellaceae bacterium]|nr:hypothetical protein [Moraxellaceae bacterium]